jgi:two-component system chemotaxis sensor kinase CheA
MDLRDIYLEEAEELLNMMEDTMLLLENSPEDLSHVAEIFRHMHTLKGTSSMYGSTKVADFIHDLETIYDKVRSSEIGITKDIIENTFAALDHLKNIVRDPDITDEADQKNHEHLTARIKKILNDTSGAAAAAVPAPEKPISEENTYHIFFQPSEDAFMDGTNPLLLVDELAEMGKIKVFSYLDKITTSEHFEPEKSYAAWDIILVTKSGENEIRDVFIFVEDLAKIKVTHLAEGDLLTDGSFAEHLPEKGHADKPFTIDELLEFKENGHSVEEEILEEEAVAESTSDSLEEDSAEMKPAATTSKKSANVSSIRVPSDKLDELMNQVSELITAQAGLSLYAENNFDPALEAISENVEKLSRRLRDIAFGMTLIKINNLFGRFQRTVRDISQNLGKSVDFITEGGETELDKKIIENLSDPLLHLIRNCLDHGIESPEERVKKGKPRKGTIKLKAYYSGAKVYIVVQDDGKGLDAEKIRAKAIEKKLIAKDQELSEREIYDLIFHAGFSTAQNVTDLSGRGVGMDVVRKNILDIRGDISVDSQKDVGMTITLSLPLTLSVIDGLLVKIKDTNFVVPLGVVKKVYQVPRANLNNEFNQLIILDDEQIPYLDLRKEFHMLEENMPETTSIVVIQNENKKLGLCVDTIEGEYQAVLKPVGKYYRNQEFVAGATILGDGSIALVLDTYKIIAGKLLKHKISA